MTKALDHLILPVNDREESLNFYEQSVQWGRKSRFAHGLSHSLRALGEALMALDRYEEALPHLQEAAVLFAQMEERPNQILMLRKMATIYEHQEHFENALATWQKVQELSERNNEVGAELQALEGMARVRRQQDGEAADVLDYYSRALQLAQKLDDRPKQGDILNSMGILQWNQGNYEKALSHYEKALDVFHGQKDQVHAGLILNSIGVTLKKLNRHDEAIARLQEALTLHDQTKQALLRGHALGALGEIHHGLGNKKEALSCFQESLEIRQNLADRKGEGWMFYQLARVHYSLNELDQASRYVGQASTIATECGDAGLNKACKELKSH